MGHNRISHSGILEITIRRISPKEAKSDRPEDLFEVVSVKGDPLDAKWLTDSISSYGVGETLGFRADYDPKPPVCDWFVAYGRMWAEHANGHDPAEDYDYGFSAEGYEELPFGPDRK